MGIFKSKCVAILMSVLIMLSTAAVNASALENTADQKIILDNRTAVFNEDIILKDEYSESKDVIYWENGNGSVTWNFTNTENGEYNFYIKFRPLKNEANIKLEFLIDGENAIGEKSAIELTSDWVDDGEIKIDLSGNEIAPSQVLKEGYFYRLLTDNTGVIIEPYSFNLSAGSHTVTFNGQGYSVAIAEAGFVSPENTFSYEEVSKDYKLKENPKAETIVIQAENASIKTDNTLIAHASNNNSEMTPVDSSVTKINYIGGSTWSEPGQKITWDFTVKESGYYKFGARYKQNELVNGESWRWLRIDGKTPFEEAKSLRFAYGTNWQAYEFADNDEDYYIWLEAGNHTLSLENTLGDFSSAYAKLDEATTVIGNLYLQIVMITGETPDTNRDYELFNQIPDFNETLISAKAQLEELVDEINKISGKRGSQFTAAIDNMTLVIDKMIASPYIAHIYVKDFYTNYTTLSSWLDELKSMPLSLDEMRFEPYGGEFQWNTKNIFEKIIFSVKRFIRSFADDYNNSDMTETKGSLKIWVNWGRDQAMALDTLIRESFTAETGIKVELQIVNNSLINGLLAGDFPDLQLNMTRTDPVNLGIRGALTDLTEFSDYEDVLKRFQTDADTPYWYDGHLYALPDQQTFYCMFYRTDVFEQLGLEVPTNWDEFLNCATKIQRYNMSVYVPYTQITTTTTVNSGIGSLHLYPTLMLQSGQKLYNADGTATDIVNYKAINVFDNWLDMYTDYGYLKEADFYNRFRNGSMPLGIAPYTTYMTIYSAAPEIQGRWSIANVPGTVGGNNYVAGGGTGCGIVKESKNQQEAWEFLKWWTSKDTQVEYSRNVESILGVLGRISTSNVEAFKELNWDPGDLKKLLAQWECVREIREVPASYYVTRAVDQAFWSVINDGSNPQDAIKKWAKIADNEILRKLKEFE